MKFVLLKGIVSQENRSEEATKIPATDCTTNRTNRFPLHKKRESGRERVC